MKFLQQPSHILAQLFHCLDAFLILLHLPDFPADAEIPIRGARDYHLPDKEEVVHGIEGMDRAASPMDCDRRSDLPLQHIAVSPGHHARTVYKGFHLAGYIGKIGW